MLLHVPSAAAAFALAAASDAALVSLWITALATTAFPESSAAIALAAAAFALAAAAFAAPTNAATAPAVGPAAVVAALHVSHDLFHVRDGD